MNTNKEILCWVISLMAAHSVFSNVHLEVGETMQDEAVATALDEGLTQEAYLAMSYGTNAMAMLDAAFEARAEYYLETGAVIKHLSNGDIRNVNCREPSAKSVKKSFLRYSQRMKRGFFSPTDPLPCMGRMYGITNAFEALTDMMQKRTKMAIKFKGTTKLYKDTFDANGTSYSFWPLGIAVHSSDSYAEETAHFFNAMSPMEVPMNCKGTWTETDYARVSRWHEFTSALRGIKVHALSIGINLNNENIIEKTEVDADGNTNTIKVAGTSAFDEYYNLVSSRLDAWSVSSTRPIATNSYILLLAYREALAHEGTETDNAAYRRFRGLCRNCKVAQMVL